MNGAKKRKTNDTVGADKQDENTENPTMAKIGDQFRDLKEKLAEVTEEEWAAIPAVADYRFVYRRSANIDVDLDESLTLTNIIH